MNVRYKKEFLKDIDKLLQTSLRVEVTAAIQSIKQAEKLSNISNLKKLKGYKNAYRIRIGDYRIGLVFEGQEVVLARLAHRRDIYRLFP